MSVKNRLDKLEAATPAFPILMVGWGMPDDGLYHGAGNATYTPDELAQLEGDYQVIVLAYGPHPQGDGAAEIDMTWGDENGPDMVIPPAAISG